MSAVCAWLQGKQQLAEDPVTQTLHEVRRIRWTLVELRHALSCALEVYLDSPRYGQHVPALEDMLARLSRIGRRFAFAKASADLHKGRHEERQGRPKRALFSLERSLKAAPPAARAMNRRTRITGSVCCCVIVRSSAHRRSSP